MPVGFPEREPAKRKEEGDALLSPAEAEGLPVREKKRLKGKGGRKKRRRGPFACPTGTLEGKKRRAQRKKRGNGKTVRTSSFLLFRSQIRREKGPASFLPSRRRLFTPENWVPTSQTASRKKRGGGEALPAALLDHEAVRGLGYEGEKEKKGEVGKLPQERPVAHLCIVSP